MNTKIEEKVLTRMERASLHLLEASHLCWNNEERDVSDEIREVNKSLELLAAKIGGDKAMKIRRKLINPRRKK